MGFLFTFLKYFLSDLPVIITSFFCMWCVINIYLPVKKSRRWTTLIMIELFEHLVIPIILFFVLLGLKGVWVSIGFHLVMNLFLFGFLGKVVTKTKGKEWLGIAAIWATTYFFVFAYPYILITLQYSYSIGGWWILGTTSLLFFIFYELHENQQNAQSL